MTVLSVGQFVIRSIHHPRKVSHSAHGTSQAEQLALQWSQVGSAAWEGGAGEHHPHRGRWEREASQVDVVPQTPKPSQSKDCAQTYEDSELRVHVSSEHGQKLRGLLAGPADPACLPTRVRYGHRFGQEQCNLCSLLTQRAISRPLSGGTTCCGICPLKGSLHSPT